MTREELLKQILNASLKKDDARVFCIVGPNGAGKSRFLEDARKYIAGSQGADRRLSFPNESKNIRCLILPALRNFQSTQNNFHQVSGPELEGFDILDNISESQTSHSSEQTAFKFQSMGAMALLQSVEFRDKKNKVSFDKSLLDWAKKPDHNDYPKPVEPQSTKTNTLNLLSKVLSRKIVDKENYAGVHETLDPFGIQLEGRVVSLDRMSDGEKQLFMLVAFFVASASANTVILIDEPELHLNEARADEIWSLIENHLSEAVFVYSTHSMSFATRNSVDKLLSIDLNGSIDYVDHDRAMPAVLMREMVGARVRLLKTKYPIIFCEDRLTKSYISDIMSDYNVDVVPLTGRSDVINAAKRQAGWDHILSEPVCRCGVIDRDEMIDEEVARFEERNQNVFVLPYNEIECLLIDHDVLRAWVSCLNPNYMTFEDDFAKITDNATKATAVKVVKRHISRLWQQFSPEPSIDMTPDDFKSVHIKKYVRSKLRSKAERITY